MQAGASRRYGGRGKAVQSRRNGCHIGEFAAHEVGRRRLDEGNNLLGLLLRPQSKSALSEAFPVLRARPNGGFDQHGSRLGARGLHAPAAVVHAVAEHGHPVIAAARARPAGASTFERASGHPPAPSSRVRGGARSPQSPPICGIKRPQMDYAARR